MEDALQMNFVFDNVDSKTIPKVTKVSSNLKRGSWKKRRADAKIIVQRVKKANRDAPKEEQSQSVSEPKPLTFSGPRKDLPNDFSSSIFTANPQAPRRKPNIVNNTVIADDLFTDTDFSGLGIHKLLSSHLEKVGVKTPTKVQRLSIPTLLSNTDRDVIIQAQTGSGKTYAFLLPIVHKLLEAAAELENNDGDEFFTRKSGAFAVILAPTRELAQQISGVLEKLLKYSRISGDDKSNFCKHWIVSGIIVGGESRKSEKSRLRKGLNIIVATPGRLLDHLKATEAFSVENLRWLVMDEADNLMHLGFEETLREIFQIIARKVKDATDNKTRKLVRGFPSDRQTILCSATIEGGIKKLVEESLRDPLFVKADEEVKESQSEDTELNDKTNVIPAGFAIPANLKQKYFLCPAKLRLVGLIGLIRKLTGSGHKKSKIMIFMSTGDSVDWHFEMLKHAMNTNDEKIEPSNPTAGESYSSTHFDQLKEGHQSKLFPHSKMFKLHGSMLQLERQAVYSGFTPAIENSSAILFSTDVAARGLDVPDVTHVIQYDPPADVRDYIHRVGRTARLGKDGESTIFLLPSESEYLDLLEDYKCFLQEQAMEEVLQTLVSLSKTRGVSKKSKHKSFEVAATDIHMELERLIQSDEKEVSKAQKAYSSHVRAYTTHVSSEKHIFHVKKLHLGHVAKSFCLREAPQVLQKKANEAKAKDKIAIGGGVTPGTMKRKAIQMAKIATVSEFADGNIIIKKQKN